MTEAQATSLLDKLWANLHEDRGSNPRGRRANFFLPQAGARHARASARVRMARVVHAPYLQAPEFFSRDFLPILLCSRPFLEPIPSSFQLDPRRKVGVNMGDFI